MAVGVVQYQKPVKQDEDKSFMGEIAKPLSIAKDVSSIYSSATDAMDRRKKALDAEKLGGK